MASSIPPAFLKKLLLKYTVLLLAGLLLEWWILSFSGLPIPINIPGTPINIGGLSLIILLVVIFIALQLALKQRNHSITVYRLTLNSCAVCFFAELIFQSIRQTIASENTIWDKFYYFSIGVGGVVFMSSILSFLLAYLIKKCV